MRSSGEIPEMFNTGIKNRYTKAVVKIDKNENRRYRNDRKEFYLESNNEIDLFLKSGLVVFNDEVNNYINEVAKQLLVKQDKLKDNLTFYPIKFDYSNAFAFNEGIVFVNVGLLARLNNEAELAFILGHESTHYLKKHSIKNHIESKKAKRREGLYRKTSLEQQTKAVARFSRQHESEADMLGFKILEESNYNPYAAITALEGLNYSNDPVLNSRFNKAILEKGLIRIPQKFELDTSAQNMSRDQSEEEDEDSIASHPALGSRIAAIEKEIKPADSINKSYFINGQERFEYVRDLCRMELCRLYLLHNDLDNALYLAVALSEQYPENIYLKRIIATTLYRFAIAVNHSNIENFLTPPQKCTPGLAYQNNLLRKMKKEELSLVALRYVWETKNELSGYPDMQEISNRLMTDYIVTYKRKLTSFADAKTFSDSLVVSFYKAPPADTTKVIKTKGRKTRKAKTPYDFNRSFASFALSDLIANDAEFVKQYNEIYKSNGISDKDSRDDDDEKDVKKTAQEIAIKKEKKKTLANEPIDGLILIEPEYSRTDYRKKLVVNYVANEESEVELRDIIKFCAHKADFDLTLLSANNIEANETDVFNEYTVLKEWLYECFKQGSYKTNTIPTDFNRLKLIGQKYNTRYAAIMINTSVIDRRSFLAYLGSGTLLFYSPLLFAPNFVATCVPRKEFVTIFGIIDMYENKIVAASVTDFNRKENPDLLKSQIYGTFISLKGKQK